MTAERKILIDLIIELSDIYPDMRLGQLVSNLGYWANGPTNNAAWDATDLELIAAAEEHLKKTKKQKRE